MLCALLVASFCAFAQTPTANPRTVSLKSALEIASHSNLELAARYSQIAQAEATEAQARAAAWPKISGTAILSPIYGATGDALHSTNDLGQIGIWLQSSVMIIEPLYTWGKLSHLRQAAARGTDVTKAEVQGTRDQIAYEVKELFYGAVLAEQLYNFLEEGKRDIEKVLKQAEADQAKPRPTIAKRDFYRLKIFAAEAEYRLKESQKLCFLTRHALSLKLGFDPIEETLPQETILSPIEAAVPSEDHLVEIMLAHRPEMEQLKNGILAKQALLAAEQANKYPMFFAGGLLTFAYSNVRTGQESAFAYDPYNRSSGGAGFGVQWSWDFATVLANESHLRAEIDELEKKEIYAKAGFHMQLKKVLAELNEAKDRLQISKEALQIGRRWLITEFTDYTSDRGRNREGTQVKNLIDAYLARAKTMHDHWNAIYRLNMGWAELARTVGVEITPSLAQNDTALPSSTK